MKKTVTVGVMILAVGLMFLAASRAAANNITVTNVTLQNQNAAEQYGYVDFDLKWDNSWRTAVSWDAAWVFVKFKAPGSNDWQHATLSTNNSEHLPAVGSAVSAPSDGRGVFIHRSAEGAGNVSYAHVRLRWNYGADGYNFPKGAAVDVSVNAVEMVYVPQGPFYLGSTGTEPGHFYQYTDGSQNTNAFLVSSEGEITVESSRGNLWAKDGTPIEACTIPSQFPKGYNAFYCMKYEISQGQFAGFLNKLTGIQYTNRHIQDLQCDLTYTAARGTITGAWDNVYALAPDRACNFLPLLGTCAYADWAGLRPMTELEYEKACRGSANPVANEYAWGSINITGISGFMGTDGSGTETASPPSANCKEGGFDGAVRCGIFAKTNSTREQAGASYWGIMELSGNLSEPCMTVENAVGRAFTGLHGDGVLDSAGLANVLNWPAHNGCPANGVRFRTCGYWGRNQASLRYNDAWHDGRYFYMGGRCVRTAP